MVRDARAAEPGPPEARRRVDPRRGLVSILRGGEPLVPGEGAIGPIPGAEHVPGARPVLLDAEREVGLQSDRRFGARGVGGVAVIAHERPVRRGAAVIEGRLADELDLDVSFEALDRADEHVVGVVVGGRPRVRRDRVFVLSRSHGQGVADDDPPVRRLPGRL
jgi:hypothetical protein